VTVQFTLGALTVLSERQVGINTAHVATGAALLATVVLLTLLVHRHRLSDMPLSNTSVALPETSSAGVVR
jgi:heme A synthase